MEQKSISDLISKSFVVPTYQRGYRWTKHNVLQMYQDIYNGLHGEKEYNLQVLVIKKTGENKFSVVDGQQRLTTLFIIISCLRKINKNNDKKIENFKLEYEARKNSEEMLSYLNDNEIIYKNWDFFWSEFKSSEKKEVKENIDFRYMFQAYQEIYEKLREISDPFAFYEKIISNCYFIWYDFKKLKVEKEEEAFIKLNMGKISLTDSELIKSEFLNPINHNYKDENEYRYRIQTISKRWTEIEKSLYNPDFWAFIPHQYQYEWDREKKCKIHRNRFLSRMDSIFLLQTLNIMYDINNKSAELAESPEIDYIKEFKEYDNSQSYVYEYIKNWISLKEEDKANANIDKKWNEIEKLYSNILELYESDGRQTLYEFHSNKYENIKGEDNSINKGYNIFNLISYIIYMDSNVNDKPVYDKAKIIIELINENRQRRERILKNKIIDEFLKTYDIKIEKSSENNDKIKEIIKNKFREFKYIENNDKDDKKTRKEIDAHNEKIKNIFLLFNIILLQKNPGISSRYNFLDYNYWTIEHIFSQNEKKIEIDESGIITLEEKLKKIKNKKEIKISNIKKEMEKNIKNADIKNKGKISDIYNNKIEQIEQKTDEEIAEIKYEIENEEYKRATFPGIRKQIINELANFYDKKDKNMKVVYKAERKIDDIYTVRDYIYIIENIDNLDNKCENKKPNYEEYIVDKVVFKLIIDVLKDYDESIPLQNIGLLLNEINETNDIFKLSDIQMSEFCKGINEEFKEELEIDMETKSIEKIPPIHIEKKRLLQVIAGFVNNLLKNDLKYFLRNKDNLKKYYEKEVEDYFKNKHNSILIENNISNLTLLRAEENRKVANEFIGKKEMISLFLTKGTVIPYSTLLVFTDRYMDLRKVENGDRWQWLPSSREKYLDDIVNTIYEFLKVEANPCHVKKH